MLITLLGVQVDEIYIYSAKAAPKYIYKSAPPHAASRRRLTGGGRWRKADEPMSDNSMLKPPASTLNRRRRRLLKVVDVPVCVNHSSTVNLLRIVCLGR